LMLRRQALVIVGLLEVADSSGTQRPSSEPFTKEPACPLP